LRAVRLSSVGRDAVRVPVVCLALLVAPRVSAVALLAPRPVSSAIAGPTDPHVAAAFYNPAALGPLRGLHLYLDGGPRVHLGSIDRTSTEGGPAGSTPIAWSDLDAFVGASWDLWTESVTLAIATSTPFVDLTQYRAGSAVQYHAEYLRMATLEQTAAVALKLHRRFFIGASANFGESWIDQRWKRDAALAGGSRAIDQPGGLCGQAACGLENPLAAQDLRVRAWGWGIGFTVGVLVRPVDRLWLAASYLSRIFNIGRGVDLPLREDQSVLVRPAPGQADPGCTDPSGAPQSGCTGNALVNVAVPDIVHVAVRVELTSRVEVEGTARYVHYGVRPAFDYGLQGGQLQRLAQDRATAIPTAFRIDYGLKDAWGLEGSARFLVGERVRLSPSLMVESSAVDLAAVNAAAIDAPKIDAALTAEYHPMPHLVLGAHVGGTAYVLSSAGERFSPRAQAACVDASYSLDACQADNAGNALPAAAGKYTQFVIHLGAALGIDY
jgi:long-subunit fatty acid transport protein